MTSRELKQFHFENRTHVSKKVYEGTELNIENAVNAPMGLTLYGNAEQKAKYFLAKGGSVQAVTENSPSAEYPSEISPKIAEGTYRIALDNGIYELSLPDMYSVGESCDKVMIDELTKTVRLKQEIDSSLLDNTKLADENTQAVLEIPVYTELELTKVNYSTALDLPLEVYGKNLTYAKAVYQRSNQYESVYEDDRECIRFIGTGGFYKGLTFKENTRYTVSFDAKVTRREGYSDFGNNTGEVVFEFFYADGTSLYKHLAVGDWTKITLTSQANKTISYIGTRSYYSRNWIYIDINTFQLEEGTTATEYEAFNGEPPESYAPSEDYPQKFYKSLYRIKCANGDGVNEVYIPDGGYAVEVSDSTNANLEIDGKYYAADVIEYDEKNNTAVKKRYIDADKLDFTKSFSEQTEAVLSSPVTEEIVITDTEYNFSLAKSLQDGCTVTAEGEEISPLWIKAKVKVI